MNDGSIKFNLNPEKKTFTPITPDGRTGYDEFNQLMTWTVPDEQGYKTGRHIRDVRGHTCYLCRQQWQLTTESLSDQTSIEGHLMHETCYNGWRALNSYYDIQDMLIKAGFLFDMEEVPPRYPHSTPWQRIKVLKNDPDRSDSGFRIVLGRRKRVWELRVHKVGDLANKFEDVNDTKGFSYAGSEEEPLFGEYFYVHAYAKEQCVDYLKRFREAIPASISREVALG